MNSNEPEKFLMKCSLTGNNYVDAFLSLGCYELSKRKRRWEGNKDGKIKVQSFFKGGDFDPLCNDLMRVLNLFLIQ